MLTYMGTKSGHAKVYAYKKCIWSAKYSGREVAEFLACQMLDNLNMGDLDAAVDCAWWCLDNREGSVNICLGPYYSLNVETKTIKDRNNQVVMTLE